jgi:hypothetical protein
MGVKERWRILDEFSQEPSTLLLRRNTPWGKIAELSKRIQQ